MNINMNDSVKVKLNDLGLSILEKNHHVLYLNSTRGTPEYVPPKVDEEGYSTWQIWELFDEFGEHVYLGSALPFETGMIIVK